jgi:hypothetical protein
MKLKRMFALLLLAMGLIVANAAEAVGAVGPQGPQGPQGVQGKTGKTGATGAKGIRGDTGLPGAKGITGNQGKQGAAGPKGGAKGDQGIPGTNGGKGDQGLPGDKGDAGTQIADGTTTGDMLYWDETQIKWVVIPAPVFTSTTQNPPAMVTLHFCSNSTSPTWKTACDPIPPSPPPPPNPNGPYKIGDVGPAGGIVFYITNNGYNGLEAAPVDQSAGVTWGCIGTSIAGAYGTAIGTGLTNTIAIINECSDSNIAAKVAYDYTYNGYTDWFLPSLDELNLLYLQNYVVGGFTSGMYWSSTEDDINFALSQRFSDGMNGTPSKVNAYRVRSIRPF